MKNRVNTLVAGVEDVHDRTTRSQKIFAEWLLGNSGDILELTIEEVALKIGISRSTILRFCKLIDVEGYRGLRSLVISSIGRQARETDDDEIVNWLVKSTEDTVRDTFLQFDFALFDEAVKLCAHARSLLWFGEIESGSLASCAAHKCLLMGMDSRAYLDIATLTLQSGLVTAQDTLIIISWGGDGNHVLRALAIAKEKRMPVIGITVNRFSKLAEEATIPIIAGGKFATHENRKITIRAGQEGLLNALVFKTATARQVDWHV